jgi:hypothetical protein
MSFLVKKLYKRHRDKIKIAIQYRNGNKIYKKWGLKLRNYRMSCHIVKTEYVEYVTISTLYRNFNFIMVPFI